MKSSKIEVDIVSDTGILIMLLLVMITKMMIMFLLVLLLLLLTTNESNFFFSIITLYTKNVKQIKNTINSAPITIYVVEGKLNVKKKKKKVN